MEGLIICKKVTPQRSSTAASPADTVMGLLVFVALLVAIPFLLIGLLISILRDKFAAPKSAKPVQPRPTVMHKVHNNFFLLRYHYIMGDEISAGAWDYFGDDEPLVVYQSDTSDDFFKGYFSDFKIESPRGIFVQKVNCNPALTEVESMPLCFFSYATKQSEELLDLKGYNLYVSEQPNYFTITATSQEEDEEFAGAKFELEISLTDALYSPPEEFNP